MYKYHYILLIIILKFKIHIINSIYKHLIAAPTTKLITTAETTPFIYRRGTNKVGTDKSTQITTEDNKTGTEQTIKVTNIVTTQEITDLSTKETSETFTIATTQGKDI